jgi:hypothetical protein
MKIEKPIVSKTIAWLSFVILLIVGCAGCAPSVNKPEQAVLTTTTPLNSQTSFGQTFTAHFDGLDRISVYLVPTQASDGKINLFLRENPHVSDNLRTAWLPLSTVTEPGYYLFKFTAIKDSTQKDYYQELILEGSGNVKVGTSDGNSYLNGALYRNGSPEDDQLTFKLEYRRAIMLVGLLNEGLVWLTWLLAGAFLFILPGWALISLLWHGWQRRGWWEKLGLGIGASLVIYPLLILWTDAIGLHLGVYYAWIPPVTAIILLLWKHRKILRNLPGEIRLKIQRFKIDSPAYFRGSFWSDLSCFIVVVLLFGARFWSIRQVIAPMWGDSYQHTMIAQLLVDNRGLFNSWAPYAGLQSLTYHFGFHSLVAAYSWLTSLPILQAILIVGQIINGLAILALYPLAMRLGRSPWAGIAAMLSAGLLFSMPMFYTNWGRYTQLAGLAILPSFIYFCWLALEPKFNKRTLLISATLLAGLALTHYRVAFFALAFLPAVILFNIDRHTIVQKLLKVILIGSAAFLLALPWLIHIYGGKLATVFLHQITRLPSQAQVVIEANNALGSITQYLPVLVWILLPLIIAWGLWKNSKDIAILSLWWLLIVLIANPNWLNIPGVGAISSFAVIISAYIPAGLLIGYAIGELIISYSKRKLLIQEEHISNDVRLPMPLLIVMTVLVLVIGLWGARQRLTDIHPLDYSLVTRPDFRAAEWIKKNTPQDAKFLVNGFPAFRDVAVVGADGGWWLPLISMRQNNIPPLPYISERVPDPGFITRTNDLVALVQAKGLDDPQVIDQLHQNHVSHIYIGQQQGRVNNPGFVFSQQALLDSPHYRPIYQDDRVWIFEVLQ